MKIFPFNQSNITLPQLGGAPAMLLVEGNVKCIITCWLPSEEDKKAIAKGEPIFLQVYKEMPVTMIYTVDSKTGLPNLEK